jgi:hypothetical protein
METGETTDMGSTVMVVSSDEVGVIVGVVLQAPDVTGKTTINNKAR